MRSTYTKKFPRMWRSISIIGVFGWMLFAGFGPVWAADQPLSDMSYGAAEARKVTQQPEHWITADHSSFEALQKNFNSGPEVTKACLSCHNEAGEQVHNTIHWTWICPADPNKVMGKNGLTMNNF